MYLANSRAFGQDLEIASKKLRYDGLRHDFITSHGKASTVTVGLNSGSEVVSTINKIQRTMKVLNHALHRGEIYGMTPGAKYAYVYLMDVETYLHKMLVSDELKESIVKHRSAIEALLYHPSCEIIEQLKFDYDLIEVMSPEGTCFKITERAFINYPTEEKDIGKISPRLYVPYDSTTPPDPKYFGESVISSFKDPKERVNFLNKFL